MALMRKAPDPTFGPAVVRFSYRCKICAEMIVVSADGVWVHAGDRDHPAELGKRHMIKTTVT